MKTKSRIILASLCLVLISISADAADYKSWQPLVPNTLGGLARSGEPDGINMEMSGQSWSSLHQEYSNDTRRISLTIISGVVAPQAQAFQMMSHMQMETAEQIVKSVNVSGYKALFQLVKNDKQGILSISVNPQTLVVIEAVPIADERELSGLAKEIPLGKIAAQVQ